MIPYLAIIKDSFRAAWQSYTLWALFLVVTFLLMMVMPFGYSEMVTGRIGWSEVRSWPAVLAVLHESAQKAETTPTNHIWSLLSPGLRTKTEKLYEDLEEEVKILKELGENEKLTEEQKDRINANATLINQVCQQLQEELDEELLEEEDFYDEKAWADTELGDEAKDLIAQDAGDLTEVQLRRRNRLLLEAAFPMLVPPSPPVSVHATYAGKPLESLAWGLFPRPDGDTKDEVIDWYRSYIGWIMEWPVSTLLVFVAIIATSGIMPRMFEPGSITLLLSKPIGRGRLFLAQFVGACVIMLLVSLYFILGVWLLAGIRLSIWNPVVFLCVPLFTFQFMVYYSVSAFIGLIYRNPIISVVATALFVFICFCIGWLKVGYESSEVDAARLVHIVDTGDMLVASDDPLITSVRHYTYDETNNKWKEIFIQQGFSFGGADRAVFDPSNDQLLAVDTTFGGLQTLSVGRARDTWIRRRGAILPPETLALLVEPDGHVLAVSRFGFFRLTGDTLLKTDPTNPAGRGPSGDVGEAGQAQRDFRTETPRPPAPAAEGDSTAESGNRTTATDGANSQSAPDGQSAQESDPLDPDGGEGLLLPGELQPRGTEGDIAPAFTFAGPEKLPPIDAPMAVNIDPGNGRLVIYANGTVATYETNEDGQYHQVARKDLDNSQQKAATVASAGSVVIVARDDGKVFILDPDTLSQVQELSPAGEVAARFLAVSKNDQWVAMLFHNRQLWLYNTRDKKLTKANIWTQGDISAVAFSGNKLLIVDRVARVREFELPSLTETRTFTPQELPYLSEEMTVPLLGKTNFYTTYRWLITPLYTVLPKPGELGWAMNYLATGEETKMGMWARAFQRGESTSDERHQVRDPWRGVRSCALFIIFMLAISCWRISRTEF